jgi:hypothetical protein
VRRNAAVHTGAGFVGGLRAPFCPLRNDRAAERPPAEYFDEPLPRHPSQEKDLALIVGRPSLKPSGFSLRRNYITRIKRLAQGKPRHENVRYLAHAGVARAGRQDHRPRLAAIGWRDWRLET